MSKLYLMLGYPGAGKTTTAKAISEITGAEHLSSDTLRLELFPSPSFSQTEHEILYKTIDKRTEELLRAGKDVIYDANLNRLQHRQEKYEICERTGAKPVLVWVQTPLDVAKERATHNSRLQLATHDETLGEMFDRIAGIIEAPGEDESYIAVDGRRVSKDYVAKQLGI